jgi:hypothetical protein
MTKKIDLINAICLFLIFFSIIAIFQFYYNNQNQECISNPLLYSAQYYSELYGVDFSGYGSFKTGTASPIIIVFDKYNVTIQDV